MQSIQCHFCSISPKQFTILICDHIICSNCTQSQSTPSRSSHLESILCKCNVKTYFNKPPPPSSRQSYSLTHHTTTPSHTPTPTPQHKELSNQMDFLSMQFKKAVQEASTTYTLLLKAITSNFQALTRNVKLFYFECKSENTPPNTISKTIQSKYEDNVGKHLNKLIESLSHKLFSIQQKNHEERRQRNTLKCNTLQDTNIEYPRKCKYYKEKERLLGYIAQLKEQNKLKKTKINRKMI